MAIADDFLALSKQLYPTGRVFWNPPGSNFEGLCEALNVEKVQFYNDSTGLYDSMLPDNDNFTADDATIWERIYGLNGNASLPLAQRKSALLQVMSFPGQEPARSHYLFIQGELQEAGFPVYVYENIFPDGMGGYMTKTPYQVSGNPNLLTPVQYGDGQYGDNEYGQNWINKIANSVFPADDLKFDLGGSYVSTFFIGGSPLGSYVNIPASQQEQFRQLVLRLKPVQNVAFTFINFV